MRWRPGERRGFPSAPLERRPTANGGIASMEQAIVGRGDIPVAAGSGNPGAQALPLVGKKRGCTAAKPPVKFLVTPRRDAPEDDLGDTIRMGFGINKRQRAAP